MDTYVLPVGGIDHTVQMSDDEAKRRGLKRHETKAVRPSNKAVRPANKSGDGR